jgi:hypothetical protein
MHIYIGGLFVREYSVKCLAPPQFQQRAIYIMTAQQPTLVGAALYYNQYVNFAEFALLTGSGGILPPAMNFALATPYAVASILPPHICQPGLTFTMPFTLPHYYGQAFNISVVSTPAGLASPSVISWAPSDSPRKGLQTITFTCSSTSSSSFVISASGDLAAYSYSNSFTMPLAAPS